MDKTNPGSDTSSPRSKPQTAIETYEYIQSQVDNKLSPNHFSRDKPKRNFIFDNIKKITKTAPQLMMEPSQVHYSSARNPSGGHPLAARVVKKKIKPHPGSYISLKRMGMSNS